MSIRLPLKEVGSFTDAAEEGAGSVAGGIAHAFILPQDTDNVVVKMTASVEGAYSAILQTTDDGGTTWYDVARTSIVSNANATRAEWISAPVCGFGVRTGVNVLNSVISVGIGNAAASSLGSRQVSGLPILSQNARVFIVITGDAADVAYNTVTTKVMVNSQSATA